jgi:hypothetical protein
MDTSSFLSLSLSLFSLVAARGFAYIFPVINSILGTEKKIVDFFIIIFLRLTR